MSSKSKLSKAKAVLTTIGSLAATAMVVRTVAQDFMPPEVQDYLNLRVRNLLKYFSVDELTLVIYEFDGLIYNQLYEAAEVYLGTKISPNVDRLKISKPEKENNISVTVEPGEEVIDVFDGHKFKWVLSCKYVQPSTHHRDTKSSRSILPSELRSLELSFCKELKEKVLGSYLPYVLNEAKSRKEEERTLKIFTINHCNLYGKSPVDAWTPINLDHPATFDTLAMEEEMKEMVLEDLERFVQRRELYRKIGKAWKRGYLLYGPPGTGKSSLIAAMANYLKFDVYDLELSELQFDSELRLLLLGTANRSILVVEDIDCTIELQDRIGGPEDSEKKTKRKSEDEDDKVTLSGVLNCIDGLWSTCSEERIVIFTTNHKDKLDPALLRPGRMDVHVHMSYCTPCGFKLLAGNYLGIKEHELFGEIEALIQSIEVTPAEVGEQLLKSDEPTATLRGLIDFLRHKRNENEEAKAKKALESVEKESKTSAVEQEQEQEEISVT
ncbi:AAA-ATPase At3g50940-like [Cornus florida]|uniref:AAA-ATPase At3g50940-like n=1 Tax=Cornus florida TaxID=4283 RepID=UPI00289DB992|nr:AAA-ATPase At3g50940-like [Cornus florida]